MPGDGGPGPRRTGEPVESQRSTVSHSSWIASVRCDLHSMADLRNRQSLPIGRGHGPSDSMGFVRDFTFTRRRMSTRRQSRPRMSFPEREPRPIVIIGCTDSCKSAGRHPASRLVAVALRSYDAFALVTTIHLLRSRAPVYPRPSWGEGKRKFWRFLEPELVTWLASKTNLAQPA
jgi:hypothetical protein